MLPGSLAPFSEGMVGGVAGLIDVHGIGGAFFGVPVGPALTSALCLGREVLATMALSCIFE